MATKDEMARVLGCPISDNEAEFIKQYYFGFAANPGNYQGSSLVQNIRNDLTLHSDFIAGNYQTVDNAPIGKNKKVTLSLYDSVQVGPNAPALTEKELEKVRSKIHRKNK